MKEVTTRLVDRWTQKFESDYQDYITPQSGSVRRTSNIIRKKIDGIDERQVINAWVYDHIVYVGSNRWRKPESTLSNRRGDCEDVTFLIASMLPHFGYGRSKIEIGRLKMRSGEDEFHTWNRAKGDIIDGTAGPEMINEESYKKEESYIITYSNIEREA